MTRISGREQGTGNGEQRNLSSEYPDHRSWSRLCCCLFLVLYWTVPSPIDIAHADGLRRLTVDGAVKLAEERNPAFVRASLKYESERLTYLKTLDGLGWSQTFTSSVKFNRDEAYDYKSYNTATGRRHTYTQTEKVDYATAWNMKRTQPKTGLQVDMYSKLNANRSLSKYELVGQAESLTDATSSKYRYTGEKMNPEVGVNFSYPIVGGDKKTVGMSYTMAEIGWSQARNDFEQAQRQLLFTVQQGYYDLLRSRTMTALRKKTLADAEERLDVVKQRRAVGLVTELEVAQSEMAVLRSRADLADAVFTEQQSMSRFNSSIGLPLDEFYDLGEDFPVDLPKDITMNTIQMRVIAASEQLKRANKDVEESAITVEKAKGKLQPKLTFTSNLALEGERRTLRKVVSDPESKYSFGLLYDFPFGEKVSERADVEVAQASLSEKVIQRDEMARKIVLDATRAYQDYMKAERRLTIARQSIEVAQRALAISQAKFNEGRAEITEVIQAKDALVGAEVEELTQRYSCATALAQLEMQLGVTL